MNYREVTEGPKQTQTQIRRYYDGIAIAVRAYFDIAML